MALLNLKKQELECKIVYYGPGRSGKTSNLDYIYKQNRQRMESEMVSIDTEGDMTLFFDFVPMGLGKIKGLDVRVQMYTVPGQVRYEATRRLVLNGVDGVIFVADSLKVRRKKNIISLIDLQNNLKSYGKHIAKIPLVMQYNKRDLESTDFPIMSLAQMDKDLNRQLKVPAFSGSALTGKGVNDTLKQCLILTLRSLKGQTGW